jgi:hypothetical protein
MILFVYLEKTFSFFLELFHLVSFFSIIFLLILSLFLQSLFIFNNLLPPLFPSISLLKNYFSYIGISMHAPPFFYASLKGTKLHNLFIFICYIGNDFHYLLKEFVCVCRSFFLFLDFSHKKSEKR